MNRKAKGVWPLWNLPALEQDEASEIPASLGTFSCTLRETDAPMRVRFGACEGGPASRAEYKLAWQKNGWELLCERGALMAFGAKSDVLAPEGDGLSSLFAKAIRRRENARIVSFVLAALCMIVGYGLEGFTVVRLAAVPLVIALVLSLSISRLQKAGKQMSKQK